MTGQELYDGVLTLGHAASYDDAEKLFYRCANLSLCRCARLLPLFAEVRHTLSPAPAPYYTALSAQDLPEPVPERFRAFADAPLAPREPGWEYREGRDFLRRGKTLLFSPHVLPAELTVRVILSPLPLTADTLEQELTVREEGEAYLTLSTAALLWQREDPELAAVLAEQAAREEASLRAFSRNPYPATLCGGNGWA